MIWLWAILWLFAQVAWLLEWRTFEDTAISLLVAACGMAFEIAMRQRRGYRNS